MAEGEESRPRSHNERITTIYGSRDSIPTYGTEMLSVASPDVAVPCVLPQEEQIQFISGLSVSNQVHYE